MEFPELKDYLEPFLNELRSAIASIRDGLDQDRAVFKGQHAEHYQLDREHRESDHAQHEALRHRIASLEQKQAVDEERFRVLEKKAENSRWSWELIIVGGLALAGLLYQIFGG